MRYDSLNWQVLGTVTETRVPLITAIFKPLQITCDITFTNGLGVQNTMMLAHLFEIQPEAAKLCLVVKEYLKIHCVELKNYVVVLLCIFFLQNQNYLPSIQRVQATCRLKPVKIAGKLKSSFFTSMSFNVFNFQTLGFEVQFDAKLRLADYGVNTMADLEHQPNIIISFFKFYSTFNFNRIISPYFGYTLIKPIL